MLLIESFGARFKSARLFLEARVKGMTAAIREDCGMSEGLDFVCGDCWLQIACFLAEVDEFLYEGR